METGRDIATRYTQNIASILLAASPFELLKLEVYPPEAAPQATRA